VRAAPAQSSAARPRLEQDFTASAYEPRRSHRPHARPHRTATNRHLEPLEPPPKPPLRSRRVFTSPPPHSSQFTPLLPVHPTPPSSLILARPFPLPTHMTPPAHSQVRLSVLPLPPPAPSPACHPPGLGTPTFYLAGRGRGGGTPRKHSEAGGGLLRSWEKPIERNRWRETQGGNWPAPRAPRGGHGTTWSSIPNASVVEVDVVAD
jgi:hypothetical protein